MARQPSLPAVLHAYRARQWAERGRTFAEGDSIVMARYILRRLIQAIPLLLGVSILIFVIIHAAPGSPTDRFINPRISPADIARISANLGLDQPVYVQYFKWLWSLVHLDLGVSFVSTQRVTAMIAERMGATLLLTGSAILLSILVAVPIGVLSALRKNSIFDYSVTFLAFIGIAIPNFWFGLMMIVIFAVNLHLLPAGGMYTLGFGGGLGDRLVHLVMPVLVLSIQYVASWTRFMRSSMLEVIREDYIRTAKAKGLAERVVNYKHAFRNALMPIVTLVGLTIPDLFGGAFVTESIFAWPGMGRLALDAVFQRDYPVLMGTGLFFAVLVVIGNLLADLGYALVDPRIRYE